MFESQQLKSIEFELANKCNARCPQCPRYSQGKLIPGLNKDELFLEDIVSAISIDTIKQLEFVTFKGTTGDPIVAKDFIEILNYFKQHNPNIKVYIATNGGLYGKDYWQQLAKILGPNDKTVFGIDGLSDTHHLYRVGTKFDTVLENALTFIEHGGVAYWQFIKFAHNEHQLDVCQQMSIDLGFHNFIILHSDRNFMQTSLKPSTDHIDIIPTGCVSCMSFNKKEVFIYADGTVYPCCYLGGMHTWNTNETAIDFSMLKRITDPQSKTIPEYTLTEIIDSDQFQNFKQIFDTPLRPCKKYCS